MNHSIKLLVTAGKAAPTPPVGPALGQKGVKAMDFCRDFNARTAHLLPVPMRVRITVAADRSFAFSVQSPPTSWLLRQALGLEKLSPRPSDVVVGTLSLKHIYHVALLKQTDDALKGLGLEAVCSRILAQANAMGIQVVN